MCCVMPRVRQVTSALSAADGMMGVKDRVDRVDRVEGLETRSFLNSSSVEHWMEAPSAVPHKVPHEPFER